MSGAEDGEDQPVPVLFRLARFHSGSLCLSLFSHRTLMSFCSLAADDVWTIKSCGNKAGLLLHSIWLCCVVAVAGCSALWMW